MLRRVANHLYWTARYLERAEWRARIVDVNYHLLVESPPGPSGAWGAMLAITGDRDDFNTRYEKDDEASVLAYYAFDENNASSIRSCIGSARENCRALRHRISSELWLEINTLYLDAQRWTPRELEAAGVYGFFSELRERFYRIAGVIQTTISRDVGFDFLTIGRSLECAENISRLLDVKYHLLLPRLEDVGSPLDLSQWAALLRSASALEAYRRAYGNLIRADKVVEILLFDGSFPRAARFCLDHLGAALGRVEAAGMHANGGDRAPAAHALGVRLRAGAAPTVIESGLHEYLLGIQDDCAQIGEQVFAEYLKFE
ncbi:MAG TPA: alpha-E domain-containing protein [Candidatus Binataceae bacterium]|nr:alpha-E domain-containing protein [Candidatus Binataceae bacterium]